MRRHGRLRTCDKRQTASACPVSRYGGSGKHHCFGCLCTRPPSPDDGRRCAARSAVHGGEQQEDCMRQGICQWSSIVLAAGAVVAPLAGHAQPLSNGEGSLRVMTYNAGEGTDYLGIFRATEPPDHREGVAKALQEATVTNPSSRMRALAAQIAAVAPTLVSLQEMNRWAVGPYDLRTYPIRELDRQTTRPQARCSIAR